MTTDEVAARRRCDGRAARPGRRADRAAQPAQRRPRPDVHARRAATDQRGRPARCRRPSPRRSTPIAAAVDLAVAALRGGPAGALLRRGHVRPARRARRRRAAADVQLAAATGSARTSPAGRRRCGGAVEDAEDDAPAGAEPRPPSAYAPATSWSGSPPAGAPRTSSGACAAAARPAPAPRWSRPTRTPARPRSVDVFIGVDTGPEVVTGSTRMKAADRAEAGAQRVLHRGHGAARPGLLQPDDRHGRHQREAARPHDLDPGGGHRAAPRRPAGRRSPTPTATSRSHSCRSCPAPPWPTRAPRSPAPTGQVRGALALLA